MIDPGQPAPDFTLLDHEGVPRALADYHGRRVVLYFYPADDTPTCTTQACGFRTSWRSFQHLGVEVLGVSPDLPEAHRRFRRKFRLPFTLLSDPDHAVAIAYGAWAEKVLYGRRYTGMIRTTYLIDSEGMVSRRFDRVRTAGHAERVLDAVRR